MAQRIELFASFFQPERCHERPHLVVVADLRDLAGCQEAARLEAGPNFCPEPYQLSLQLAPSISSWGRFDESS